MIGRKVGSSGYSTSRDLFLQHGLYKPDIYLQHYYAAYNNPCCNTIQFERGLVQGTWTRVNEPASKDALDLHCRAEHVAVVPIFQCWPVGRQRDELVNISFFFFFLV